MQLLQYQIHDLVLDYLKDSTPKEKQVICILYFLLSSTVSKPIA